MKRALITGINGFTGSYVASELRHSGFDVWGLGSQVSSVVTDQYHQADILDVSSIAKAIEKVQPNVVVHLAAVAFVAHGDSDAFYNVNLMGTRNLLSAIESASRDVDCILIASSANVYGNSDLGILDESSPVSPANDYAVSKLAMEYMARTWMTKLPIVLARPFNYTGVGQSKIFLIPKIVDHFQRKQTQLELGNIDVSRDFSDVRTVARIYRRLVEASPVGETINVCSGQATSIRELIQLMENISGYDVEIKVNPAFVRSNEVKQLCGDTQKLTSVIGNYTMPPLEDTLRWMFHARSSMPV